MKNLILNLLLLFVCVVSNAQLAGDLDTSFGTNGIVTTNIAVGAKTTIYSSAVQSDGKTVIVGNITFTNNKTAGFVKRINLDGTDDLSFAELGTYISNFENTFNIVKIKNDGKIVIASEYTLTQFNSDGTLDNSFNAEGGVVNSFASYDYVASIGDFTIQPDGKIVVFSRVSSTVYSSALLRRYNIYGGIDTSFGTNGTAGVPSSELYQSPVAILSESDGKLLVSFLITGYRSPIRQYKICRLNSNGLGVLASTIGDNDIYSMTLQSDNKLLIRDSVGFKRYNTNLTLDTTFGGGVVYNITFAAPYGVRNLGIKAQADGKILILNYASPYGQSDPGTRYLILTRLNADGTYDNTFNGTSFLIIHQSEANYNIYSSQYYIPFNNLNVYNNQFIVACNPVSENNGLILKGNSDATFDATFGNNGQKIIALQGINSNDIAKKTLIQADGKILVCGSGSGPYVSVVRYNSNGSIDNTFGNLGVYLSANPFQQYLGNLDFGLQSDGKIIFNLKNQLPGGTNEIIRLNANGTSESNFTTVFGFVSQGNFHHMAVRALKVLPNDGVFLSGFYGYSLNNNSDNHFLMKFNPDRYPNTTFNVNGREVSSLFPESELTHGKENLDVIEVQNDGKVLTAGYFDMNNSGSRILLLRHNSDGTIDTSFGNNGLYTTSDNSRISSMALQNDGKIVINVLHFSDNTPVANNFSVSRINPDGTLDTTFGINGTAQTTIGNSCNSNFVKVLANQKILVTGYSSGTFKNFAMVKYNPDGSLDTAFGDQGKVITDFNAEAVANCVVLTNDNKLILSGYAKSSASGSNDFAMAKYYLEDALGTASHELSDAVVFYPNPTNNLIHFNQNIKTVSVYSLDGKQIYARLENNKMDCSSFSKGLYMIQATTEDKRVINQKLIKN